MRKYTLDVLLRLKDAGAIAASAAAQVGGANKILDFQLGATGSALNAPGRIEAVAVIDVSAIDVSSGDEKYEIELQFSNDNFVAQTVVGPVLKLGDSTVTGGTADSVVGRYELMFVNEIAGVLYRYCRAFTRVAGTTPSINYVANVAHLFEANR